MKINLKEKNKRPNNFSQVEHATITHDGFSAIISDNTLELSQLDKNGEVIKQKTIWLPDLLK